MFLFTYIDYNDKRKELFTCSAPDILVADKMFQVRTGRNAESSCIGRKIAPTNLPEGTEIATLPERPSFLIGSESVRQLKKTRIAQEGDAAQLAREVAVAYRLYMAKAAREGLSLYDRCFYCGVHCEKLSNPPHPPNGKTLDHIHPRSRGGTARVPACVSCNSKKATLNLNEFRVALLGTQDAKFFAEHVMRTGRDDYQLQILESVGG